MRLYLGVMFVVITFLFNNSAMAFELKGVPLRTTIKHFQEKVPNSNCEKQENNPGIDLVCFEKATVAGVPSSIIYMFKNDALYMINVVYESDKASYSTLHAGLKEKYGSPEKSDWGQMISLWDLEEGRTGMILSLHDDNRPDLGVLMIMALDKLKTVVPEAGKKAASDL